MSLTTEEVIKNKQREQDASLEFVEAVKEWREVMNKFVDNQMKMNEQIISLFKTMQNLYLDKEDKKGMMLDDEIKLDKEIDDIEIVPLRDRDHDCKLKEKGFCPCTNEDGEAS